jgi:hypothetical protein
VKRRTKKPRVFNLIVISFNHERTACLRCSNFFVNGRRTRKVLTAYEMHHTKSDIDWLRLKIRKGERGLLQNEVI